MNQDSKNSNVVEGQGIIMRALLQVVALLKSRKFWVELVIMTVGMFVAALGVYFFLIPSKLIVGSITGLSLVLAKLLPFVSVGIVIFIINAVLLVLSFVLIGNEFGAKTVYTALILGPMIDFIGKIFPMSDSMFTIYVGSQAIANPWFDLLCFVLILSASQSILFNINASTGGLDFLAKIINKYTGISLGASVTFAGGAICCTAFAINPPYLVLIGLIGTWLNGLILNYFMMGLNVKNRVFIISKDYERIQDYVLNSLCRGVTLHEIIGGYSNQKSMQLEIVLTNEEMSSLMAFLRNEEIDSFCTCDTVSEVRGLWNKGKKPKKIQK